MPEQETENQTTEQNTQVEETQAQSKHIEGTPSRPDRTETFEEEQAEPEVKESIADKIGNMISAAKEKLTGGGGDNKGTEIPDEFTTAARKMNWSDEDTTAFAADFTDEQLKEMIPSLLGENAAKAGETSDKASEKAESETTESKDEDSQDDEKLKPLLDRIAELEKAQGISAEKSKKEELGSFVKGASDLFDKASEEFEVFGKTKDLPKFPDGRIIPTSPQMKARNEVFGMAQQLKEAGISSDKALEFSLNAYKGANLATETKRIAIKDLKKQEQKLGGKRVSHEIADNVSDANLSGPDVIAAVARRHGIEIRN